MYGNVLLISALICLLFLLANCCSAADIAKPLVGVYVTQAELENAHRNIAKYDWAKSEWERTKQIADSWLEREDDWIRKMVPAKGSTFSYGTTGCPACGANWPRRVGACTHPTSSRIGR